jgi:hypothetical protein
MDSASNSLLDYEPIEPSEVNNFGVVISIPLLYVHTDEFNGVDQVTPNYRVIDYDVLESLVKTAIQINTAKRDDQIEICDQFIKDIITKSGTNSTNTKDLEAIVEFLKASVKICKDLDIEEDYTDITTQGLSFDVIRQYVVAEDTKILQSAEPTTIEGLQLYSQIPQNSENYGGYLEYVNHIRKLTNDTDFNRIQLYLSTFEKTLTFTPGFVYSHTVKLINLSLFYLCLMCSSRPVKNYCSNDIKGNLLGYIVDVVFRSRVIQAWQKDPKTKKLLADMIKNYDDRNHIIQFCQLNTSRERAQYFSNILKNKPDLKALISQLNYDSYMEILETVKMTIDGQNYYLFNSNIIASLATIMPNLKQVQDIYTDSVH